jgi:WXG100 family type VII secretion target
VDRTQVDAAILAQVAGRFEQVRDDLKQKLTVLRGVVDGVRGDWQGSGGASFQNVTVAWQQRQEDLIRVLTETAQGIRSAGTHFASSNEEAAATINRSVDLTALGPSTGGSR